MGSEEEWKRTQKKNQKNQVIQHRLALSNPSSCEKKKPGSVNTPMSAGEDPEDVKRGLQGTVQKRRAEAEEVAGVIVFLLGEEAGFVTGAVVNVDGGWMC